MEAEVEYEGLPDHAGLGIHMLAGALVSITGDDNKHRRDAKTDNFHPNSRLDRLGYRSML